MKCFARNVKKQDAVCAANPLTFSSECTYAEREEEEEALFRHCNRRMLASRDAGRVAGCSGLEHRQFLDAEQTIVQLHSVVGNRYSLIAAQLPGLTYNQGR